MINLKHNFIFCHTEKTAGTSMACALGKLEGNYCITTNMNEFDPLKQRGIDAELLTEERAFDYPNKHNPMMFWRQFVDLSQFFCFGFVRNPKERLVALYLQQLRQFGVETSKPNDALYVTITDDMHKASGLAAGQHCYTFDFFTRLFVPLCSRNQVSQFYDPNGNMLANFVGRFENLHEDWAKVCERIGMDNHLPRKRVSAGYDVDDFFDDDLLEFFFNHDFYSAEYEVFGYEKG